MTGIKIQKEVLVLISQYGLRNLNMDLLAQNLGISKATIYKTFSNKDQLVLSIIEYIMAKLDNLNHKVFNKEGNPIFKLLEIYTHFFRVLIKMNPNFFIELKKLYPSAAQFFENQKNLAIHDKIKPLLVEAKEKRLN